MDRKAFFDAIKRGPFKRKLTQNQVNGVNGILSAFVTHGDGRAKTLAYALATAYHEVGGRMMPVREGFARTDSGARTAVRNRKYGKPQPPYGHVYYGRGYVQLTWKENYARSSADAGVDLVKHPDRALDPVVGAKILIKGLIDGRWNGQGKGIAHYLTDSRDDLKNARRTVNITDKWQTIGGYYKAFLAAIDKAGGVPVKEMDTRPKDPAISINGGWSQGGPPQPDDPGVIERPVTRRLSPMKRFFRIVLGILFLVVVGGLVLFFAGEQLGVSDFFFGNLR